MDGALALASDPVTALPDAAIRAIDLLNGWARGNFAMGCAIYRYKNDAIRIALKERVCVEHYVKHRVTCRDCRGTGRYENSYGDKWPHCRKCSNTGVVHLEFVETSIPLAEGIVRWHSPMRGYPYSDETYVAYANRIRARPLAFATTWRPNLPARALEVESVASALTTVEAWWWGAPDGFFSGGAVPAYTKDIYAASLLDPVLDLGRAVAVCRSCKKKESAVKGAWYHQSTYPVEWSAFCCDSCRTRVFEDKFPHFVVPEKLTPPPVIEWMKQRRQIAQYAETLKRKPRKEWYRPGWDD